MPSVLDAFRNQTICDYLFNEPHSRSLLKPPCRKLYLVRKSQGSTIFKTTFRKHATLLGHENGTYYARCKNAETSSWEPLVSDASPEQLVNKKLLQLLGANVASTRYNARHFFPTTTLPRIQLENDVVSCYKCFAF